MKTHLIIALSLAACTTRTSTPPPAPAPVPTRQADAGVPATDAATLAPAKSSLIDKFVGMVPALAGKCEPWEANSVICRPTPTLLLYCEAFPNSKPQCEVSIDWTPPPVAPATDKPKK